ncbi:hypothetical protein NBRC111894_3806 [Sporolactobacillus inulinus]|uniref:Uncharacterized protein n=1 Tax=Sporolactobacillus inulinus TaxID=2078 RepID=A0A4Y1ZGE5_9BACL|nr:hypothetical protein NBRC111894_3806 [Sporolactobacillus inulinus]
MTVAARTHQLFSQQHCISVLFVSDNGDKKTAWLNLRLVSLFQADLPALCFVFATLFFRL